MKDERPSVWRHNCVECTLLLGNKVERHDSFFTFKLFLLHLLPDSSLSLNALNLNYFLNFFTFFSRCCSTLGRRRISKCYSWLVICKRLACWIWTKRFHNVEKFIFCTSFCILKKEERSESCFSISEDGFGSCFFSVAASLSISSKWNDEVNEAIEVQRMRYFRMIEVCSDTEHAVISDTHNVNVARYESHVFCRHVCYLRWGSFSSFLLYFLSFIGRTFKKTNLMVTLISNRNRCFIFFICYYLNWMQAITMTNDREQQIWLEIRNTVWQCIKEQGAEPQKCERRWIQRDW